MNDLNQAQIWDLAQRTCRQIPGNWSSGVFLAEDTLVMAARPRREQPGGLVRLDTKTLAADDAFFARPWAAFEVEPETRFEALTMSPDGARVAASASPFQRPLVCVWETRGGRLTHWITGTALKDPVSALSFASDGRQLLSAGDSPEAKLWDLTKSDGAVGTPIVTFEEKGARNVTCGSIQPGPHRQLVTGHSDGRLLLWSWADGKARQAVPLQILAERFFNGAVHAVTFTPDGRYLAAVGDQTAIWLAEIRDQVRRIRDLGSPPHHLEQINALATWAGPTPAVAPALTGGRRRPNRRAPAPAGADQRQRRHHGQILGPRETSTPGHLSRGRACG